MYEVQYVQFELEANSVYYSLGHQKECDSR